MEIHSMPHHVTLKIYPTTPHNFLFEFGVKEEMNMAFYLLKLVFTNISPVKLNTGLVRRKQVESFSSWIPLGF